MRRYLIFLTSGFSLFMYAIDGTIVAVAFPEFTRDLQTTVLWSAWTLSIFFIAVTMTMPLAGNLVDTFGRKKVLIVSLVLFTGSSLACGLAPTIHTLIAFRFLQGIGGACFLPTASGIVSDIFPESREAAIGLFSSIFSVGAVIGPNLGGWIVSQYSWRYIFYVNVPIGIVLIAASMMLLKESRVLARPRVDLLGVALMSSSLLFLMFGLNLLAEKFSDITLICAVLMVLISVFLSVRFLRQEKRAESPILDIALLRSKPFIAANVANLIIGVTTIGAFSFIPLYAVSVHKLSTLMSGMILTPRSVAMAVTAAVTSFLLKRWGYRWPMVFGFGFMSFTTMLLSPAIFPSDVASGRWGTLGTLSALLLLNGIGAGAIFPAANNACIELMPEKVGTIVALRNMFRNVGAAVGVSLLTVVLHVSSHTDSGFTLIFISLGLLSLASVPLLFLMPAGRDPTRS